MSKLKYGDKFKKAGLEWTVIEISKCGYKCLAEAFPNEMRFGENNNWKECSIRKYLNGEFLEKLAAEIGKENIIPFERNLLSLDGQTEYGVCTDHVSLLTVDEYRENRSIIPNTGNYWWWTITPDSTKSNRDDVWVTVVSPSGNFYNYYCRNCNGVRPVCIFSSSIF